MMMSASTLLVEEEECEGLPVCGANLSSPVVDQANYIQEIHYKVGSRLYIENAD
jgi:hypothetical protein